jgi:peptidoglycan/xylan/chitin deacetylase (PgdA/CDA1 family)
MKIRTVDRLRWAARRLKNMSQPSGLILLYHRVVEVGSDPWSLCVSRAHFAEHLEVLRRYNCPMRLQQLGQALRNGTQPRQAVVITFDDGYADNLYHAKPILERYEIPATVFVISGYVGQECEFWWDDLDRLLLQPGTLPTTFHLEVNGRPYQWDLDEAACYSEDAYRSHRRWNYMEKKDPSARHRLYRSLYHLLRRMREDERRNTLDALQAWAAAKPTARSTHRTLSADEVLRLTDGGLIEVGAHTTTHPVLSTLQAATQRQEIQGSKDHLEQILGCPVLSFAYPYGSRSDYTTETTRIVQGAGFDYACSVFGDAIWRRFDRFQFPRISVGDWDGETFARITRWLSYSRQTV